MDDLLKNLAIGVFSFLVIHGSLEQRARHNAERQVRESFDNTGRVRVRVQERGAFGLIASDLWAVDIYGEGLRARRLPFLLYPRKGWKGSIRHLRLHFRDFTLGGLPIERFEADVPFATFDIGHALWKDRLVLRSAGVGPAVVRVGEPGLRAFILRKYEATLSDVEVLFQNKKLVLTGRVRLFGDPQPFSATGRLIPRAGRYIDLTEPVMRINDALLSPSLTQVILKQINPVLDIEADLGLKGFFTITDVEVGDSFLMIRGTTTVPPAATSMPSPSTEKDKREK